MPVNLSDIVKAHGVVALCKYMVEQNSSFGATEADLVALATADAHRRNPTDTPSGAFAKLYMESAVLRDAIEIARAAVFANAMAAEIEKDARKACDELAAIGKQRWPSMSPAQRFARAFETNPELAARAHRRPGPSTSFPFAKASSLAAPVVDPKPTIADAQNIDDPQEAIRQLAAAGARKWPNESKLRQLELALTDEANRELVTAAFRPTGSSPPRK